MKKDKARLQRRRDAKTAPPATPETVDHPSHYGGEHSAYEVIKVIEAWELGFHLGNTVKYIGRAGKKSASTELEDLKKARWYLDRKIQQMEESSATKSKP